jgi:hypothetical protein
LPAAPDLARLGNAWRRERPGPGRTRKRRDLGHAAGDADGATGRSGMTTLRLLVVVLVLTGCATPTQGRTCYWTTNEDPQLYVCR